MDILERAAALLGASAGAAESLDSDRRDARIVQRLERNFTQIHPSQPQKRQADDYAAQSAGPEAAVAQRPGRIVSVDQALLRAQRIITPTEKRTMMTESFRRVKRHILANAARADGSSRNNLVMITSALPGEGKTFCAINLAMSLAMEIDRTVMLVDADFEKPSVPAALGLDVETPRGFIDVIADSSLTLADVLLKTDIGKLTVLPAGTPHAHTTELVAGDVTATLLREMADRYDDRIILFDSAPLLAASESCTLAPHMGQIVLVVEAGKTTEKVVKEALESVASCNVAGVLLNKGAPSRARSEYGDGYGAAE